MSTVNLTLQVKQQKFKERWSLEFSQMLERTHSIITILAYEYGDVTIFYRLKF